MYKILCNYQTNMTMKTELYKN